MKKLTINETQDRFIVKTHPVNESLFGVYDRIDRSFLSDTFTDNKEDVECYAFDENREAFLFDIHVQETER